MKLFNRFLKAIGGRAQNEKSEEKLISHSSDVKPNKYFIVGFDFGTHGTKVAYRDVDADYNEIEMITFRDSGTQNRNKYVLPSLISIKNDILYFGCKIENATVIENFKCSIGLGNKR